LVEVKLEESWSKSRRTYHSAHDSVEAELVCVTKRSLVSQEVEACFERVVLLVFAVAVVHGSGTDTLGELLVENVLDFVDSVESELLTSNVVEPIELPLEVPVEGMVSGHVQSRRKSIHLT